jgi:multiple antibiotic resistance protein
MEDLLLFLPNTFIPLFVAIDIFGLLPIIISMTEGMSERKRRAVLRQSVVAALAVGLAFMALGEAVFAVLGITVNDFKVAGGLLLLVLAVLEMAKAGQRKRPAAAHAAAGVVPIGIPLIVGPAVMTTLIVLVEHFGVWPTVASLLLNFALVWLAFLGAGRIVRFLGTGGIMALTKIMAILLASIGVMMVRLGVEGILGAR